MQTTHTDRHSTSQTRHSLEFPIAKVIQLFGEDYRAQYRPSGRILSILHQIERCRTAFFGGRKITCTCCSFEREVYNSCGNRNCPTCQSIKKELWVDKRKAQLLPTKHFHVIFTVPHQLNILFLHFPTPMYQLLFNST